MNHIHQIIKEEIIKYLKESDNIDLDLYEKLGEIKTDILVGFLNDKERGIKEQPWQLVPFARLKKYGKIICEQVLLEILED